MSQYLCKIIDDTGMFYVLYDTVIDQFVTRVTLAHDSKVFFEEWGEFDVSDPDEKHT